jgi:hypothetical protein
MKCEISLTWRNGEEDMTVTRSKTPDEVWESPLDGGWRSIEQMIRTLDNTYADARAALIAMLPSEMRAQVSVVINTTPERARKMMEGQS